MTSENKQVLRDAIAQQTAALRALDSQREAAERKLRRLEVELGLLEDISVAEVDWGERNRL